MAGRGTVKELEEMLAMASSEPAGTRPKLYFDDLHVGQRFTSRTQLLDERMIIEFARQYDPQPFHTDPEAAKHTLFKGLIASGWHTMAVTMRLLIESGPAIEGGMIGMGAEVSWPRPTRPGDILRVDTEIIDLRTSSSRPDRGVATIRCHTRNQRDEVVQVLTCKVFAPRRS
jgi:acyl dehydratase